MTRAIQIFKLPDYADFFKYPILRAKAARLLKRVLAIAILSVCLSHGWISQKKCKIGS